MRSWFPFHWTRSMSHGISGRHEEDHPNKVNNNNDNVLSVNRENQSMNMYMLFCGWVELTIDKAKTELAGTETQNMAETGIQYFTTTKQHVTYLWYCVPHTSSNWQSSLYKLTSELENFLTVLTASDVLVTAAVVMVTEGRLTDVVVVGRRASSVLAACSDAPALATSSLVTPWQWHHHTVNDCTTTVTFTAASNDHTGPTNHSITSTRNA